MTAALAGRVHVPVEIPRTAVKGQMRLVGRSEALQIVSEARELFKSKKLPTEPATLAAAGLLSEWNAEVAVRHLAIAVRRPDDASRPLESLDEWRECDDEQISALWEQYKDLQDRIDPLAKLDLGDADRAAIEAAAKKKPAEVDLLTSYGSRRLALYVISTVAQPST